MRARALVFAILALVFAVGAAMFVRGRLTEARQQIAEVPDSARSAKNYVLVTANELASGDLVRQEDLRWQSWPDSEIVDTYLVKDRDDMHGVVGGVVSQHLAKGEPVTASRIVKPGERGFLAAVLSAGSRAVTVPLSATSGVGGLIIPGDHIDLILSHQILDPLIPNAPARLVGETVLCDLRVVAIDQAISDEDKKAIAGKSATLEVTPKQAEIVEVAKQLGNLSLSLRSAGRGDTPLSSEVTHTWDSDVSPLIQHDRPDAPSKLVVTVLRGKAERSDVAADTPTPTRTTPDMAKKLSVTEHARGIVPGGIVP